MKMYYGVEAELHALLTSPQGEVEWSASRASGFTPGERAAGTHRRGGRVGLRADL